MSVWLTWIFCHSWPAFRHSRQRLRLGRRRKCPVWCHRSERKVQGCPWPALENSSETTLRKTPSWGIWQTNWNPMKIGIWWRRKFHHSKTTLPCQTCVSTRDQRQWTLAQCQIDSLWWKSQYPRHGCTRWRCTAWTSLQGVWHSKKIKFNTMIFYFIHVHASHACSYLKYLGHHGYFVMLAWLSLTVT